MSGNKKRHLFYDGGSTPTSVLAVLPICLSDFRVEGCFVQRWIMHASPGQVCHMLPPWPPSTEPNSNRQSSWGFRVWRFRITVYSAQLFNKRVWYKVRGWCSVESCSIASFMEYSYLRRPGVHGTGFQKKNRTTSSLLSSFGQWFRSWRKLIG